MNKFIFYEHFQELDGVKGLKAGDKKIVDLCIEDEVCIGHREVCNRHYHIFYFVSEKKFCLYYHGGGTDAMFTTKDLDEMLEHINALTE